MAFHQFKLIVLALLISAGSVLAQDKLSTKDKIKIATKDWFKYLKK